MEFTIYFNKHVVGTTKDDVEEFSLNNLEKMANTTKFISNYIENTLKFKSYYWNCCMPDENSIRVDYGSHINFITVKGKNND